MQAKVVFERLSRLVNRNELVFDATITLVAILVYRLIVPEGGFIFSNLGWGVMVATIVCVQFFTALFFASIIKKNFELKDAVKAGTWPPAGERVGFVDRINKKLAGSTFVHVVTWILIWSAISSLFILMPLKITDEIAHYTINTGWDNPDKYLTSFVAFLCCCSVIVAGVVHFKFIVPASVWCFIISIPFAYLVFEFPLSIVFFACRAGWIGAILFVLVTGGAVVGILMLKRYFFDKSISSVPFLKKLSGPFRVLVLPFLTALSLTVWSEMSLVSSVHDMIREGLAVNMVNVFPYLLVSGLIPVRALVFFTPPIKPLNIIFSIGALYLYFSSLEAVLAKIV
jgi:hypothetical protein